MSAKPSSNGSLPSLPAAYHAGIAEQAESVRELLNFLGFGRIER
jgi:hypothetical protein